MPKKKRRESASVQAARFAEETQKLIDAGELSPTDAEAALDRLIRGSKTTSPPTRGGEGS